MARIKCRYEKAYCGASEKFHQKQLCDEVIDNTDMCGGDMEYNDWNEYVCTHVCYEPAEFEKTVKNYEIDLGEYHPTLRIGKRYYEHITYLEIDGRVLIGGDQDA